MSTVAEAITRIREQISDEVPDSAGAYRWSDTLLIRLINDGVYDIIGTHPEAAYVTSIVVTIPVRLTATTNELPISDFYLTSLVDFVTGRVLLEDSEDAANLVLSNEHKDLSNESKEQ